jgi:hypothetical protein
MYWNAHLRHIDLVGDHGEAFSIVLEGSQIAVVGPDRRAGLRADRLFGVSSWRSCAACGQLRRGAVIRPVLLAGACGDLVVAGCGE